MTIQIELQDVISSQTIIERINELSCLDSAELTTELQQELTELEAIVSDCDSCDWTDEFELINRAFFTDYIRDLLIDNGEKIPAYLIIDWGQTANDFMVDYSSVTINEEDYYYYDM
jgi:hypothetical protein